MEIVTAAQMREIDRRATAEFGVPGVCLMQAAGDALARGCAAELGGTVRGKKIALVCGKGNNGGDGYVAARRLRSDGADVTVFAPTDPPRGDAAVHFAALGVRARPLEDIDDLSHFDLLVDCLLGTGSTGAPRGAVETAIRAMNASGVPTVACDIPSGVDADTGIVAGEALRAVRTVTFALLKPGLLLFPGAEFVGRLTLDSIGMPAALLDGHARRLTTIERVRELLPPRRQSRDANKGSFGKVAILAGSAGMAGAAVLTATAALRSGAGLVYLALPQSVLPVAATLAPEVVLRGLPETEAGTHGGSGALEAWRRLADEVDAVAIGPGLGGGEPVRVLVRSALADGMKPVVIDADGLNALAGSGLRLTMPAVLTPHPGEMGRLLAQSGAQVQDDREGAVRAAAETYGAVTVLKGARSLIATPDGRLAYNRLGSPALATAGSGDVLTGVVAALLAGGLGAEDAAVAGAWLHARAGEMVEAAQGAVGARAGEIRDALPQARRALYDPDGTVPEEVWQT